MFFVWLIILHLWITGAGRERSLLETRGRKCTCEILGFIWRFKLTVKAACSSSEECNQHSFTYCMFLQMVKMSKRIVNILLTAHEISSTTDHWISMDSCLQYCKAWHEFEDSVSNYAGIRYTCVVGYQGQWWTGRKMFAWKLGPVQKTGECKGKKEEMCARWFPS